MTEEEKLVIQEFLDQYYICEPYITDCFLFKYNLHGNKKYEGPNYAKEINKLKELIGYKND